MMRRYGIIRLWERPKQAAQKPLGGVDVHGRQENVTSRLWTVVVGCVRCYVMSYSMSTDST